MKKWVRRIALALGLVLLGGAVLSVWGLRQFRAAPEWYGAGAPTPPAEREKLARAAESKLIDAQNWAQQIRADAQRGRAARRGVGPATPGVAATAPAALSGSTEAEHLTGHVIAVSQQELNALFDKWSAAYGWGDKYTKFVEDPRLLLRDGRLILAGKVVDIGAIVAFQFAPSIDADGRLRLDLAQVTGGRLPLPESVWAPYRDRLAASVREKLPTWSRQARIDSSGAANSSAMAATMGRLFLNMARREPAEPVLFLPLVDRGQSVPVRLTDVRIDDAKLTLLVEPLTPTQRADLLQRIRTPLDTAQARGQ